MPEPLALCLEDLDASSTSDRFVRCVAVVGRTPGLGLAPAATIVWRSPHPLACELWVSGDDRLMLYRPEGAVGVIVRRAIRSLDVPCAKPVVLLDQDEIEIGSRRFRVHIHGVAPRVHAPAPLPQRSAGNLQIAAAVALSVTVAGCPPPKMEVRDNPPAVMPDPPPPPPPDSDAVDPDAGSGQVLVPQDPRYAAPPPESSPSPDAGANKKADAAAPIEVRDHPPDTTNE